MGFTGYGFVIFDWIAGVIGLAVTLVRIYADCKGYRKVPVYRDVMILAAALMGVVLNPIFASIFNHWGVYNADPRVFWYDQPREVQVEMLKISFFGSLISFIALYLYKIDLLLLYHVLVPRAYHPKFFGALLGGWIVVIVCLMIFILSSFLQCRPLSDSWAIPYASCNLSLSMSYFMYLPHIVSDVAVFAIPCAIIYKMTRMSTNEKLSAAAMFLVGSINVLAAAALIACYYRSAVIVREQGSRDVQRALYAACLYLGVVQNLTGAIVVCMPQMRALWTRIGKSAPSDPVVAEEKGFGGCGAALPPHDKDGGAVVALSLPAKMKAARRKGATCRVEVSTMASTKTSDLTPVESASDSKSDQ